MSAPSSDTIAAIATAPQNGAIGILRLSGPAALSVLQRIFVSPEGEKLSEFRPRYFHFGKILDGSGQALDEAMAVFMPGPKSFTGEDVAELHCHGNVLLLKQILNMILDLPQELRLRAAAPGEFTKRAFLNGRMDLTQAEAVHEMITASSAAALKSSLSNLDGELKRRVTALKEELTVALALVEASFEFAEEDIQTFDPAAVHDLLVRTEKNLGRLLAAHATSKLYDEGVSVVLVGRPNVGKSSLLNAILVEDRAIVTDVAGTTRDVIEGSKIIGGIRFVFRDTAGLRMTKDEVESAGIARSEEWIRKSDIVVWVSDDAGLAEVPAAISELGGRSVFRVLNKVDLIPAAERSGFADLRHAFDFFISASCGLGLEGFERALLESVQKNNSVQEPIHINSRQAKCLEAALSQVRQLVRADRSAKLAEEILAEELRGLIRSLELITGEISSDDVLGEIFRRFCIGK